MSKARPFTIVKQKAPKVPSPPLTTTSNKRVQHKWQIHSPLKSPLGGNVPPTKGRQRQTSILRFLIPEEATMFDVDNDLDDECPIGSMKQGSTASGAPSPSFNRGGL
jgi:hypothetical protein